MSRKEENIQDDLNEGHCPIECKYCEENGECDGSHVVTSFRCPNCKGEIFHLAMDYERAILWFACPTCKEVMDKFFLMPFEDEPQEFKDIETVGSC